MIVVDRQDDRVQINRKILTEQTKVIMNKLLHSAYRVSVTKFNLYFIHSMTLKVIQTG